MAMNVRSLLRLSLGFMLTCLAGLQPLTAQLDPRLQSSKTDFLDLFQQSTSFKVKPEIMTILDWSGSMQAIMYHPGYNNTSNTDGAASRMSFWLTGAAGSYVPNAYLDVDGTVDVLTSSIFVRPDGTILTEALVNNTDIASGLYGAAWKAGDIRNWIRAASHVRFTETFGSPAVTRTIDIPICWKIMDRNSTGYPLTSQTTLDQTTITNPDGSTSTYGSGTQIEMDRTYLIQNSSGDRVLSGGAAQILPGNGSPSGGNAAYRCTNQQIDYTRVYVNWLFTGKYAAGTPYANKYVIFDAANAGLAGGQANVDWGRGYGTFGGGATITPVSALVSVPAASWVVQSVNRVQANKVAVIKTWIKYQKSVFWAYRFLDDSANGANGGNATTIHNNSRSWASAANPTTTTVIGRDTAWRTMNNNSLGEMSRIASLFPGTCTPLTYAMARGLAQYADPNNVFLDVETGADVPVQCQYKFIILFTDGQDNNGCGTTPPAASPYLTGSGGSSGTADAGNAAVIANKTNINKTGPWWNLYTFAAMGAHLADSGLTNYMEPTTIASGTSGVPSTFLPFAVPARGTVTYKAPHRLVTTMTVGVSLGGAYNNTASPKYRLFAGACIGDPARTSWNLNVLTPFTLIDPNDPTKGKTANSVYFFDATDPDLLTKSLDYAVLEAGKKSNVNVTNSPTLPYIGATLGKQVYIGKFQPPKTGGTIWDGDLLAFTTRETASGVDILDNGGNPTTTLDETTGIWSAKKELKLRLWTGRKLFTRIPGTLAVPEPGLTTFSDVDPAYSIIKPFTATAAAADAAKKQVIQFMAGANVSSPPDGSGRPTLNRDSIMGDVINSAPAALEYTWPVWFQSSLPTTINGVPGNRFRMVLAGTNQGWLHAFGEVSQVSNIVDSAGNTQQVVQGKIAELWSFMPTDFLKNLNYVTNTNNPHRFMVDGTPSIYHLDLSPATGGSPNTTVDGTSVATSEFATVIIGLRKGGRSYYALDIRNPTAPVLKWSLVPDEAAFFPASRIAPGGPGLAAVIEILKKMAFSTATPSTGRVLFNGAIKDAVFFSGGLSLPEIEANFLDASSNPMKLGRSVLALDVNTGQVLAAVDMTTISAGIASIPAGLVPFEYFLNSGMAQRAYFLDNGGGLWCWGSMATLSAAPYMDYRVDSSDLAQWTSSGAFGGSPGIRKVAQDGSGNNAKYTTLPAPFKVGAFPGAPKPNQASPTAVGVAMVSGDRNNPLDYWYNAATRPTGHRATVVFDRQDSKAWGLDAAGILDSNLKDFTSQNSPTAPAIDQSNASYYLAPSSGNPFFGYYVTFPTATAPFVSKGITEPMVVAGSLFYTYFNPSEADPCSGGEGLSHSMRVCDVINPVVNDVRAGLGCTSGEVYYYAGVATSYVAYGTRGVIQAGVTSAGAAGGGGGSTTTPTIKRITGKSQERYPKPRVWRTVR